MRPEFVEAKRGGLDLKSDESDLRFFLRLLFSTRLAKNTQSQLSISQSFKNTISNLWDYFLIIFNMRLGGRQR